MTEPRAREPWHLDKKVPITLIAVVLLQTVSLIVWAARLEAKVDDHERRIVKGEILDDRYLVSNGDVCERLARLEEKSQMQLSSLERIEQLVKDHMNRAAR